MAENLYVGTHKYATEAYKEGWDRIFKKYWIVINMNGNPVYYESKKINLNNTESFQLYDKNGKPLEQEWTKKIIEHEFSSFPSSINDVISIWESEEEAIKEVERLKGVIE